MTGRAESFGSRQCIRKRMCSRWKQDCNAGLKNLLHRGCYRGAGLNGAFTLREIDREALKSMAIGAGQSDADRIASERRSDAGRDNTEEFLKLQTRYHRVVEVKKQLQPFAASQQVCFHCLQFLDIQGGVHRQRNLIGNRGEKTQVIDLVSIEFGAGKPERSDATPRCGQGQHAHRLNTVFPHGRKHVGEPSLFRNRRDY